MQEHPILTTGGLLAFPVDKIILVCSLFRLGLAIWMPSRVLIKSRRISTYGGDLLAEILLVKILFAKNRMVQLRHRREAIPTFVSLDPTHTKPMSA